MSNVMPTVVVAVLLLSPLLRAAEPASTQPGKPLLGTRWTFVEINGDPALPVDRGGPYLELSAEEARYSGIAGINRFGGSFTLDGKSLKFGNAFSTMMAGPEPLMQQEQRVMQALTKVDAFEIVGDMLHLRSGDTVVLKLQAK